MELKKIIESLGAEVITEGSGLTCNIETVCASDLMSDVLSYGKSNALLLTGLTNQHTVRTAEITDISAICFVHGKRPQQDAIDLANRIEIPLIATDLTLYNACGRLYSLGLRECDSSS